MSEQLPLISVLMGAFNCEKTLDESLNCLIKQTEERWELVICDDGSADNTPSLIRKWQAEYPERIFPLFNRENRGLSFTLNRCLEKARGEFIARMDGDDLCSPDRFEKELQFLQDHPEYDIVSVDMQCFDEDGIWGLRAYPSKPQPADLVHGTLFCHAGCMVRREALTRAGGYSEDEKYARVEDYELWMRMYAMGSRGDNLHEPLYQMRDDRNAAVRRKWIYRLNEAGVKAEAVKRFGLPVWNYFYVLRPLVLGILPGSFSAFLHRQKLKRGAE